MASSDTHIYLITGANRGIGKVVLKTFLSRPNTTTIAAVRDPASASVSALSALPVGRNSRLILVKIDSTSEADAREAVEELRSKHGIDHLDTVIANAGIGKYHGPLMGVTTAQLQEHINVNMFGPFRLFQAVAPLLQKSAQPKFVLLGTPVGSIGEMEKHGMPMFAYGASKAMAHYMVRKIHFEHQDVIAFAVDPGFAQSDMGNTGARFFGMAEAMVPLEDAGKFVVSQIDGATREQTSGHFPSFSGGEVGW